MKFIIHQLPFLLFLLLSACSQPASGPKEQWHKVHVENGAKVLQEIGILEAQELARLQIKVSGTISEAAEDSTPIQAGEVVVKLDDEELRTELDTQINNLDQIKEDLENELAEYAVLTNTFEIASRLKNKELAHAQLELEKSIIPLLPEEERLRQIDIELAELDLEDKKSQLAREEELVRKNFAPASSMQTAKREKEAAETYLEEKRSQLALDSMPLPEEERLTLETAVKNAEDAVRRNQQQQNRDLHILDLKIEGIRLKIEHAEESIAKLRSQLKDVTVIAPVGGVLRLTQKWTRSVRTWMPISIGQNINSRDIVGTIVDPDDLSLRVLIHESDYTLVKPGQKVQARLISFPDQKLSGKVESITDLGQDLSDLSPIYRQAPSIYQAMFLVNITLDKINKKLIPGMTALVEIETEAKQKRMYIPLEAVWEENGQFQVLRRRNNDVEKVTVKGWADGRGRFEVQDGLTAGDEIQIREKRS